MLEQGGIFPDAQDLQASKLSNAPFSVSMYHLIQLYSVSKRPRDLSMLEMSGARIFLYMRNGASHSVAPDA